MPGHLPWRGPPLQACRLQHTHAATPAPGARCSHDGKPPPSWCAWSQQAPLLERACTAMPLLLLRAWWQRDPLLEQACTATPLLLLRAWWRPPQSRSPEAACPSPPCSSQWASRSPTAWGRPPSTRSHQFSAPRLRSSAGFSAARGAANGDDVEEPVAMSALTIGPISTHPHEATTPIQLATNSCRSDALRRRPEPPARSQPPASTLMRPRVVVRTEKLRG